MPIIASTACVWTQASFCQVSTEWKLDKTGLYLGYAHAFSHKKIRNHSCGIFNFQIQKKTALKMEIPSEAGQMNVWASKSGLKGKSERLKP